MTTGTDQMLEQLLKVTGELSDYQQRLRTLVDALADEELFHESTQVAYAEAQKLLIEAPSSAKTSIPAGVAEGFRDKPTCTCNVCECLWKQEDDPKLASAELCIFCYYGRHKNPA